MLDQNNQMTPDEAKASLGISTRLLDGLTASQAPQSPEMDQPPQDNAPSTQETPPIEAKTAEPQQIAPQQEQAPQMADLELNIGKKLDEIRKELKEDSRREIDSLKKEIKDALSDE